jgi:hypothetical protein
MQFESINNDERRKIWEQKLEKIYELKSETLNFSSPFQSSEFQEFSPPIIENGKSGASVLALNETPQCRFFRLLLRVEEKGGKVFIRRLQNNNYEIKITWN